ncbi:unnamed protein product [Cuscuta epithymum]|uniref:Uncharacterized protein n=1 Tax=Cuscuta epithymum TaxID=186058 RepID=A0AAV0D030_9ASTE|nr:unnamed protein product [Cuscuta epithymum]
MNNSDREQTRGKETSEDFMEQFALKTNLLATTSIEIINMVQQAPEVVMENDSFKKMQEAARSILGLTGELSSDRVTSNAASQREMHWDDDFWSNENNILTFIKAENALVKRAEYKKKITEIPSFSLGMTQETENTGIESTREREEEMCEEAELDGHLHQNEEMLLIKEIVESEGGKKPKRMTRAS